MLDSIPHSGGEYNVSKEKAFEYFQNFEEYPWRYPKYCKWVEVVDRSENTVTTREFWNMDTEIDHVLITVCYELIPFIEIRYEIMEANLANLVGIKNSMKFSDLESDPNKSLVELALPILDINGHPWSGKRNAAYDNVWLYLRLQNTQHLGGLKISKFGIGQVCSECKKGKLGARLGGGYEVGNHKLIDEQFECDECHKVFKNYLSVSRDNVIVTDDTSIEDQIFESSRIIERLGSVVAKEESIQRMLRLIKKHGSGIRQEELVGIITKWGYRQKLIHQAIYFGFRIVY